MKYLLRIASWCASPMGFFFAAGWAGAFALTLVSTGTYAWAPCIVLSVVCYALGMYRLKDLVALNTAHHIHTVLKQYELQRKAEEHTDTRCRSVEG